jgi:hypothetical protein
VIDFFLGEKFGSLFPPPLEWEIVLTFVARAQNKTRVTQTHTGNEMVENFGASGRALGISGNSALCKGI